MTRTPATSFRLPPELLAALREHADERGETVSDALRDAVLALLGRCPTCGQQTGKDLPAMLIP